MRLSSLDWLFGAMILSLLNILMVQTDAPNWCKCLGFVGMMGCLAAHVYASLREDR